jgi:hypothetical protein
MDVLHDNSFRTWTKIASVVGAQNIPDYVRNYTPPDEQSASSMLDTDFADPGKRAFPIDSRASTWLSAAYFTAANPEYVLPNGVKHATPSNVTAAWPLRAIYKASEAWGISGDIAKLRTAFQVDAGQTKQASDIETNYGWIVKDASGNVTARRYGVFDTAGLSKASTYFDTNRRHYPLAVRTGIARFLMQKAAEYGIEYEQLHGSVLREAGYGIPRKSVIMRELNERALLAKDAECGVLLANVNRLIGTGSDQEVATNLDKIAETIDAFDQAEDLTRYYGRRIGHPSDFLCSVTFKQAEAFVANTVRLRKLSFDVQKLADDPEFGKAAELAMGPDFAASITALDTTKLAATLRELPQADRGALEDSIVALCD